MDAISLLELAVNGMLVGLMYSLVAIGIVLIYKSSSVPNLAQGSMTMLGAYVVLAFANNAGAPIWLAIPLAIVTMFVIGIGIERVALRRLAGRPIIMILMLTLGLEIFLRAGSMTIWGGTARPMPIGISDAPLFLGPLLINRAYAVGAAVAIVMFGLFVAFFRTRLGVVLRAISDDYTAAWSVGISVERGVALSWAMSAVVATIAGVLWSSVQGVDQSLAQLLLKGVTVAVLGGLDSIGGALLAGALLGIVEGRRLQHPRSDAGRRQPRPGGRGDADPDHPDPAARTVRPPRHRASVSACFSVRPAFFTPTTPPTGRCFRFQPTAG